ncbi:pyridoxamine 5'-phosphate oxidase family protein [Blastococcus sp. TBT05-19]|uniref:MSMEG_1061 family FMN-dependent PPOX-type flavoprotein n=1 Tax=Blastococcus sp. TBT05-19 TaxID=2250581 RepID=UPI000DE9C124|nr:MSMEG_1061 family FMN-dependent PPOX-type flavoprotein [Blastococcus sp. TBT05-19]RBY94051.1 pyridoxamine 5'-phosphate oxidase family protein [Blastococcus sp. TBT05-19]
MDPDTAGPDALEAYRSPSQRVLDKEIGSLDTYCRDFIALSPFATLATASADGWPEVSPRGGAPGFVHVLDEHRLALPDRLGNNRIDSLRNLADNPRAAIMFFVPGFDETLRVYGTTSVVGPDDLDVDLTEFGKKPLSVLVLQVSKAYFQCPKSVMRSGLWDPERRVDRSTYPSFGTVLREHCRDTTITTDDVVMRAALAEEL